MPYIPWHQFLHVLALCQIRVLRSSGERARFSAGAGRGLARLPSPLSVGLRSSGSPLPPRKQGVVQGVASRQFGQFGGFLYTSLPCDVEICRV